MKYTTLKGTKEKLGQVVLGTDVYGSYFPEENAYELLNEFCELGGNVLDTACVYGWKDDHTSEKLIGRWLKEKKNRSNIFISTKGGHPDFADMSVSRLSQKEIESDMDSSLKCLGVDYVDIYWLHRDDVNVPVECIMDTMDELVKKGKTRYIGMSNWSAKRIDEANKYAKAKGKTYIISSQIQYSPAKAIKENNDPTLILMNDDEFDYFKNNDLSVFAFASQAKGFFSKIDAGGIENLSEKSAHRYLCEDNIKRFNRIKEVSEKYDKTVGEVVISYLTSNPYFQTLPIIGSKNAKQLRESVSGSDIEITKEDFDYIMEG